MTKERIGNILIMLIINNNVINNIFILIQILKCKYINIIYIIFIL